MIPGTTQRWAFAWVGAPIATTAMVAAAARAVRVLVMCHLWLEFHPNTTSPLSRGFQVGAEPGLNRTARLLP